jgi:predicted oxidoreductase
MENLVDASPRLLGTASLSPLGYGCWRPVALVGSISPQRIADAAQALSVHLDRADVYGIIQASMGESLP